MEKLFRFLILTLLYIVGFIFFYNIVPCLAWLFGGSYTAISQSAEYAAFSIVFINLFLAVIFHECFNGNFKSN